MTSDPTTRISVKSWLGVGAWSLAVIGVSLNIVFAACVPNEVDKLKGIEFAILLPLSWFIHAVGIGLGLAGCCKRRANPFSLSGTIANVILIPLTIVVLRWLAN